MKYNNILHITDDCLYLKSKKQKDIIKYKLSNLLAVLLLILIVLVIVFSSSILGIINLCIILNLSEQ